MKVFVVFERSVVVDAVFEDVVKIFADKAKAEAFIQEQYPREYSYYLEEYEVE